MNFDYDYVCVHCARVLPMDCMRYRCPGDCGQNLRLRRRMRADTLSGPEWRQTFQGRGVWRYASLLPVEVRWASRLAVGDTPLIDCGDRHGIQLWIKDESRNPSGSLKDRASDVALAVARRAGLTHVVTASTGNAGASAACLAAAHGMLATVVVPRDTPAEKLVQIRAYGAHVCEVAGGYDAAFDLAVSISRRDGAYCRNTGYNPFTREGKKTCAYEIAEAMDWCVPDWIVVPTGDGNILSGMAAGFDDLYRLGLTQGVPRLLAAQADTSGSITQDWRNAVAGGQSPARQPSVVTPATAADSLAVDEPKDHIAAVQALLTTDGVALTVTEAQIRRASRMLAEQFGLWFEPSTAAAYAALRVAVGSGRVARDSRVVMLGTGSGLKDPHAYASASSPASPDRHDATAPKPNSTPAAHLASLADTREHQWRSAQAMGRVATDPVPDMSLHGVDAAPGAMP